MGSEEESGKDWSELEEEAARGEDIAVNLYVTSSFALRFW